MAATRVRLLPEHRNGNGNYLRCKYDGRFVASDGENDVAALVTAFYVLCDEIGIHPKAVRDHLEKHRPPHHD